MMSILAGEEQSARQPVSASVMQHMLAQTCAELMLTFRRGESLLITFVIPITLLIFFTSMRVLPGSTEQNVSWFVPGMLALAVMSTGMVSLGIATGYERHYGVIKRLGFSPLSRGELLLSKILSVVCIECVQSILLIGIAMLLYGWRLQGNILFTLCVLLLGTAVFSSFGLLLAGALRAEITLALANALYLFFMLGSGGVVPLARFPALLASVASWLPGAAFTTLLEQSMRGSSGTSFSALGILVAWGVLFFLLAVRTFRWE